MADDNQRLQLRSESVETETESAEDGRLYVDGGRQVVVRRDAGVQCVELRAPSGQLELRIRLTEDGPVLSVDAVKLEVRAEQSVNIECEEFNVNASSSVKIASKGEVTVDAADDVRVVGKMIHLN